MLTIGLILILLSNSLSMNQDKSILYSRVTTTVLIFSFLISYDNLSYTFLSKGIGVFCGLFYSNYITSSFQIFIILISSVILLITSFYPRKIMLFVDDPSKQDTYRFTKLTGADTIILSKGSEQYRIIEYSLVILFIVVGGTFLVSTNDLVSIFLSIELQSYGLYLLCTIYRDSEPATSGGIMYFLLGGLSSCFILLGTALLYANSGTTSLDSLYIITAISNVDQENFSFWYKPYYINTSLLFMSVGFLFKVSAAPFHFWSPDVYDAIPTVVTTFVSIIAKISIFVFLLALVHYTGKSLYSTDFSWKTSLILSSFFSLIIGTVAGLTQSRIKRLYAFSTISHVGFILLGLVIHTVQSTQAFIFYIIQYSIANLNAFLLIIAIGYFLYGYAYKPYENKADEEENKENNLIDVENSPIQLIEQLKGFYYINPLLSLSLAITLFSFAGIPPLTGFFAKLMILNAAIEDGYVFMCLVAILTSVVSAVYYLIIVKQIFFDKPDYVVNREWQPIPVSAFVAFNKSDSTLSQTCFYINVKDIFLSSFITISISLITFFITLFIFTPSEMLTTINLLALSIFV